MKVVNNMKEYTIKLQEEKIYKSSDGEDANEIDMLLQVWQDLNRMSQTTFLQQEDTIIKKVLEQILEKEYDSNIPVPDYYTYHERNKTD